MGRERYSQRMSTIDAKHSTRYVPDEGPLEEKVLMEIRRSTGQEIIGGQFFLGSGVLTVKKSLALSRYRWQRALADLSVGQTKVLELC